MGVVESNLANMDQFGLANVAWSLARLRVFEDDNGENKEMNEKGAEMLDTIARNFANCVKRQGGSSVRPQAFSNLLWAFGSFKYKISDQDGVLSKIYDQC